MPEGTHLRVRQLGEEGDDVVHKVLVVNDAELALLDQQANKVAEV